MKFLKLFSILVLSAVTLNSVAANKAKITVSADGTAFADNITIEENASAPADMATNNNVGPKAAVSSPVAVSIWAEYASAKYATIIAPNINGMVLKFQANAMSTNYTMTFEDVDGEISLVKGATVIPVDESVPYAFTCTANEVVTFTISTPQPTVYTRDVNVNSWGTICLPWATPNRTSLEGGTFYEALGTKNASGIALAEVDSLEAGKPYVFKATAAQIKVTYDTATVVSAEVAGNNCTGSFDVCTVPDSMYIINRNKLYMAVGGQNTIGENRAYFDVNHMGAYTPVAGRRIVFLGAQATGFEAVKAVEGQVKKAIIDGKLIIMKGEKMYNAQGMEL